MISAARRRQYGRVSDEIKLPAGYTRCDYVQATADMSCVINTQVQQVSNWSAEMVVTEEPNKPVAAAWNNQQFILYTDNGGHHYVGLERTLRFGISKTDGDYVVLEKGQRVVFDCGFDNYGVFLNVNGQHIEGTTTTYKNVTVRLFGPNYNAANAVLVQAGICWVKCTEGGKFFGVACKRDSDGIYGLYDVANKVFYGNEYYTGLELT